MPTQNIADLIATYGVAGVAALSITGNIILARLIKRLYEDRQVREQQQNEKMLVVLEKRIETDVKHEQAFRNMTKAFDRLADRM